MPLPAKFRIGPSGWSYPDWAGTVYPQPKPRGFKPLAFIAHIFNAVEVNSSFYAVPTAKATADWVAQTPSDFRFAFKLTQTFTHDRSGAPPDAAQAAAFREALAPVREAGKLGPLLIQFPWSFRFSPAAADRLMRLRDTFADCDRIVEVRHTSWASDAALEVLRETGGVCNIDQPALRDCLPPASHVFGPTAYARFHGRNAQNWFAENLPGFERYNYLYSEPELRDWVRRMNEMAQQASEVYAFANNHYRGQGVANALELRAMLGLPPTRVPSELLHAYPRLAALPRVMDQGMLFGD